MCALIAGLQHLREQGQTERQVGGLQLGSHVNFRFATIASGFWAGEGRATVAQQAMIDESPLKCLSAALGENPIELPSLHVFGTTDAIIGAEKSEALASFFVEPAITLHGGGHHVPSEAAVRKAFKSFVALQRDNIYPPTV